MRELLMDTPHRDDRSKHKMFISIAMCTCNGEMYLADQLESIADQTRRPDELVVCDDESTDGTVEILRSFAEKASFPVRIEFNANRLGTTKNFERVIKLCVGDAIALSDQDDVWHALKLSRIEQVFSTAPSVGLVFSDAEVVGEHLNPLGYRLWQSERFGVREQRLFHRGRAAEVLVKRNVVTGATMAFRGVFRDAILPIPDNWIHDAWIALIVSALADIAHIPDCLITYRQHPGSQIGSRIKGFSDRVAGAQRKSPEVYLVNADQGVTAVERISSLEDTPRARNVVRMLEEKIAHVRTRGSLPGGRTKRLPIIIRELFARRYHRYSNGMNSFWKDLFFSFPFV